MLGDMAVVVEEEAEELSAGCGDSDGGGDGGERETQLTRTARY